MSDNNNTNTNNVKEPISDLIPAPHPLDLSNRGLRLSLFISILFFIGPIASIFGMIFNDLLIFPLNIISYTSSAIFLLLVIIQGIISSR